MVDSAAALVTQTNWSLLDWPLDVWETDTNTLEFDSDDEYETADDDYGLYFGFNYSAGSGSVTAASAVQDYHLYFGQLRGPVGLLEELATHSNGRIVLGPDGKFYVGNSDRKPAAILGLDADPTGPIGTNCNGSVLWGAVKGGAGGVKAFVWDGWYALGEQLRERTIDPAMDGGFDIYELQTGTKTPKAVLEEWQARFKREMPVAERLMTYTLAQLPITNGDFGTFIEGLMDEGASAATDDFKRKSDEMQQALAVGADTLKAIYDDLLNGCPERKGEIIGRATFEIGTIVFAAAKVGQIGRVSEAVKIGEAEMITQLEAKALVQQEASVSASVAKVAESLTSKGTLIRAAGGTGANYNRFTGQGLYVLVDSKGVVKYVGRGDVHARLLAHADDPEKVGLAGRILWENNLTKAEAKGLEQKLIEMFGGPQKGPNGNPRTQLLNKINSFNPISNPNRGVYRAAATEELIQETKNRLPRKQ